MILKLNTIIISNAVEEFKTYGKCVKVENLFIFLIPSTLAHTSANTKLDNNPYKQYLLTKTENILIATYVYHWSEENLLYSRLRKGTDDIRYNRVWKNNIN